MEGRRWEGRSSVLEAYEKMKKLIASIEEDMHKAAGGNKAAGTRVRQAMQDIKTTAQDIRQLVLGTRKEEPAG